MLIEKEIFQHGYNVAQGIEQPNLSLVDHPAFQGGMQQYEKDKKKTYRDIELLLGSLHRVFGAYNEDGEKVSDPIKFVYGKTIEHYKTGGELPKGVYRLSGKTQALQLANKTGHAIAQIELYDEARIPITGYYIELPWHFNSNDKREAYVFTLASVLLDWKYVRIFVPSPRKWGAGVVKVDIDNRTPYERWKESVQQQEVLIHD